MSTSRNPAIDLLRGGAIGVVLLLHFALAYGLRDSALADWLGPAAVRTLAYNGNFGVTVFFTVSGYLITSMALSRHGTLARLSWRDFAWRRVARILPGLLLALAVVVPLGLAGHPSFRNAHGDVPMAPGFMGVVVASVLTCWHNVLMARDGYFNYAVNVYWSLSVEEVFYVALPLACVAAGALARRGHARASRWWLGGLALACLVAGPADRYAHADDEIRYLYDNLACADALALGCLVAVALRRRAGVGSGVDLAGGPVLTPLARGAWTLGGVAGLVAVYAAGIDGHVTWGFTGIALATAAVLVGSASTGEPGVAADTSGGWRLLAPVRWLGSIVRWMGRHSYELYLFHIVVLGLLREAVPRATVTHDARLPLLLAFVAASCLVAGTVAAWVTEPANRALRAAALARAQARTDGRRLAA